MKKVLIWIVILAIGYFIFGYAAVLLQWFELSNYLNLSAIIGGIASVSGLLAFVASGIKRQDIEKIGVEYFKEVVNSAEELKNKEKQLTEKELSQKEKELLELDIKKKELEFLVKKASMNLFLKDQHERTQKRIEEIVSSHSELNKLIRQYSDLDTQIEALELEIEKSENVELLRNIINEASSQSEPKIGVEIGLNNRFIKAIADSMIKIMGV